MVLEGSIADVVGVHGTLPTAHKVPHPNIIDCMVCQHCWYCTGSTPNNTLSKDFLEPRNCLVAYSKCTFQPTWHGNRPLTQITILLPEEARYPIPSFCEPTERFPSFPVNCGNAHHQWDNVLSVAVPLHQVQDIGVVMIGVVVKDATVWAEIVMVDNGETSSVTPLVNTYQLGITLT